MSIRLRKYLLLLLAVLFYLPVFSQSSQEPFGKNRVQYKSFDWKYITTNNFEIYYYGNSIDLAVKVGTYAEDDYSRIVNMSGYSPNEKTKIILYNSISDKLQSNIGLSDQEIMIGGQTLLVKSKIEIAFKGTQLQLMKDVSYGIAYTIINTVMFGGNVKDVVKSSYLMNPPEWFINGAAAYISEDWSQEMDNFMRDKILNDNLKSPSSYTGEEAKIIGQSIWNYISKEYGKVNVSNILTLTRAFRNERESIESNLGISFKGFLANWANYYKSINLPTASMYTPVSESSQFQKSKKNMRLYSLTMNKEGSWISFVQNNKGRYKLQLINTSTGKRKTLEKGGYKRTDQSVDYMLPLSAWQNEFSISTIVRKRDKLYLKNYDLKNNKRNKRIFNDYRQIYSFAYSSDGNQMVLSADKLGQTDIFIHNNTSTTSTQVTNDAYDDLEPTFTYNNNIVFSSNRQSDTLSSNNKKLPAYTDRYNLFLYSSLNRNLLNRLTSSGNNFMPLSGESDLIYFLSDKTGVVNIYKLNPGDYSPTQLTNQSTDITTYSFSTKNPSLSFISLYKGKENIYLKNEAWNRSVYNTPNTERINSIHPIIKSAQTIPVIDSINFNFNANEETDFNNLTFESEKKKEESKPVNVQKSFIPKINTLHYIGPKKYQNPFSADKIISTLMVDPLRGMGALLEGGMSDLLGNHRIDAGAFIPFDFRSSKLFGEYRYVKRRFDFKARYSRQSLSPSNDYSISQKYVLNTFSATVSYPLSVTQRISLTPFITTTTYRESSYPIYSAQPDQVAAYKSLRGEYVYDNALVTGMNMLKGTRFKISLEYNSSFNNSQKDFGLLFMDFRKYIPIHKEFILATRVSYGHYFGNSPKNFLIGGMDNWLLSNHNFYSNSNAATHNPLTLDQGVNNSDILFARYATSLRGFKYNSQFGSKYVLFNAELRLPIVKYLYKGTISSNFLRNLQIIGFTDIGTAYTNKFSFNNYKSTTTVTQAPFSATVTDYLSPFLIGFGGGLRTMFLGYYIKTDLGWGLQNNILSKPNLYITFGYDF
jgi:hypothetical protein